MRAAQINDYWRTLFKRKMTHEPIQMLLSKIIGFEETTEIDFKKGVCAICGSNGSGKTTLLTALSCCLGHMPKTLPTRLSNFEHITTCNIHEAETIYSNTDSAPPLPIPVEFINVPEDIIDLLFVLEGESLDDIKEDGTDPLDFSNHLCRVASYVIGKKYESIKAYEIENEGFPYIEVKTGDLTYNSSEMGLGELSVLYIQWRLERALPGAIILLEEPENYLSPKSQRCLMDFFARYASEKGLYLIFTTHSPHMIEKIPNDNIQMLIQNNEVSSVGHPLPTCDALTALGLKRNKNGILFVEDMSAKYFLEFLRKEFFHTPLLLDFDFVKLDGTGNIKKILETIPIKGHEQSFIGVLDGDQRGNYSSLNVVYLPTDAPPDKFIYDLTSASNFKSKVASILQVNEQKLATALDLNRGENFHDWPEKMSLSLNLPIDTFYYGLFKFWLDLNTENKDAAYQLIRDISDKRNKSYMRAS